MKHEKQKWWIDNTGALCMGDQQILYPQETCRSDNVMSGEANLKLMAMAPDLYEALHMLVMEYGPVASIGGFENHSVYLAKAREVLKKVHSE